MVKNPPAHARDTGDLGSIPGWGRSPGGRNGNLFQYSSLENPMGKRAWQAQRMRHAAGWVDLTGWRTVPHDGWIRMAFNVAPSAAAQKTEIVLVAGNSSGETPNVTTSDLTQGIDPLDRTLNYELFDFFNQGDTNNVLVPLAAGTKVGLFVYTDATDRPSSFQITDYFYAPAS